MSCICHCFHWSALLWSASTRLAPWHAVMYRSVCMTMLLSDVQTALFIQVFRFLLYIELFSERQLKCPRQMCVCVIKVLIQCKHYWRALWSRGGKYLLLLFIYCTIYSLPLSSCGSGSAINPVQCSFISHGFSGLYCMHLQITLKSTKTLSTCFLTTFTSTWVSFWSDITWVLFPPLL